MNETQKCDLRFMPFTPKILKTVRKKKKRYQYTKNKPATIPDSNHSCYFYTCSQVAYTVNFLNIRTPKTFVVITLKFELCGSTIE